ERAAGAHRQGDDTRGRVSRRATRRFRGVGRGQGLQGGAARIAGGSPSPRSGRARGAVRSPRAPAAPGSGLHPTGEVGGRPFMSVTAELHAQGKVRDIYEAGDELVMVASDRISAFDVVLPTPIPDKGRVLTGLSLFWFEQTEDLVANHLLTADAREFPAPFAEEPELRGRSMLVQRAGVVPIECVARGYLSGSGWKEYSKSSTVCGIQLPSGLTESDELPEPIF